MLRLRLYERISVQNWRFRPHEPLFFSENYAKWSFVKYKNLDVLLHFTRLTDGQTDGQTDRQIEFLSLDRVCIPCSAVENRLSRTKNGMTIYWRKSILKRPIRYDSISKRCMDIFHITITLFNGKKSIPRVRQLHVSETTSSVFDRDTVKCSTW